MKKLFSRTKNILGRRLRSWQVASRSERGQVLVVVTIAMLALVAFVGLTVDVGLLYVNHGRLRRAVDAAALAASSQFREGYTHTNLEKAAREFLVLNGIQDPQSHVDTCDSATDLGDFELMDLLCTTPKRKLVRVDASAPMRLAFLPVVGIHEVTLHAQAVSEAASLDVVLAIDVSESMTWDAEELDPMRDPYQCNPGNDCEPLKQVKQAAQDFVGQLYFPYDRVSIVTFDQTARYVWHFSDDEGKNNAAYINGLIQNLQVMTPDVCPLEGADPCRNYERHPDCQCSGDPEVCAPWEHGNCNGDWSDDDIVDDNSDGIGDVFTGFECPSLHGYGASFPIPDPPSAFPCGTTNIGAGLRFAGNEFGGAITANPPPDPPINVRTESLWAVILLSDGATNSSYGVEDYCVSDENPWCRDKWADTRHCHPLSTNYLTCLARGGASDPDAYDVNDFAKDMADFIFDDQQALIFTIGLGNEVLRKPGVLCPGDDGYDPDLHAVDCARGDNGEKFLQYAADPDGDDSPAGGEYYFAPDGDDLRDIFLDIADKLATRLTQ